MRLPDLHDALVRAAEAQEAVRGRGRLGGRRLLLVSLIAGLVCGTAAAAVLSTAPSRPLSGVINPDPNGKASRYTIRVFPIMTVGWSGWCFAAVFGESPSTRTTAYGCSTVEGSGPLVAGGDEWANARSSYSFGVVTSNVAFVRRPDGTLVRTIAAAGLPANDRAYFSLTDVRHRAPGERSAITYLDSSGRPLSTGRGSPLQAVARLPVATMSRGALPRGACRISVPALSGISQISETVTRALRWPRFQHGAFLACANATYRLGANILGLALLVDAARPHRLAPALPGVHVTQRTTSLVLMTGVGNIGFPPGSFVADFGGEAPFQASPEARIYSSRDVSARRAGPGWLIAEGGSELQRAALLRQARAVIAAVPLS